MTTRPLPVEGWGFYDVEAEAYHADPAPKPSMSSGFLSEIVNKTVATAIAGHPRLAPPPADDDEEAEAEDNKKFDVGQIAHTLVLGRGKTIVPVDAKNWATKAAKEERKQIIADGQQPCLVSQFENAKKMRDALFQQLADIPEEHDTFMRDRGVSEEAAFWQEQTPLGKLWARALVDWRKTDQLVIRDYKTYAGEKGADPEGFIKGLINTGKDIQDPHYSAGYAAIASQIAGEEIPWDAVDFAFIVQDPKPPYLVSVVRLQDRLWSFERRHWAIDRFAASFGSQLFRGFAPVSHSIPPPNYARTQWEMRMIREYEAEQALQAAGRPSLPILEPERYRIPDDDEISA